MNNILSLVKNAFYKIRNPKKVLYCIACVFSVLLVILRPVKSIQIKRNFIWFSFFKMVSLVLRQIVYHNEYWLSDDGFENDTQFIDNYSEIDFLPELVDFSAESSSFLLLDNEATHEPIFLRTPDYVPSETTMNNNGGGIYRKTSSIMQWLES